MLKIEANTTHELIDFMWNNMTSGDLDRIKDIVSSGKDTYGSSEDVKKRVSDEKLHGNEGWLIPVTSEKKKTAPKKEPPYDIETRKMIWSHRKASNLTGRSFEDWHKSFETWSNNRKRQAYEAYVKSMKQDLGCCEVKCAVTAAPVCAPWQVEIMQGIMGNAIAEMQPQKKEKKMYNECNTDQRTEAQQTKDYLIHSLNVSMNQKLGELVYEFGIEQKYPKTVGELRQAFKDGWLQLNIPEGVKDTKLVWAWMDYAKFEDPSKKLDEEGYTKAQAAVTKAASDVKDQIVVMGPAKGLEALNAFKAQTFH